MPNFTQTQCDNLQKVVCERIVDANNADAFLYFVIKVTDENGTHEGNGGDGYSWKDTTSADGIESAAHRAAVDAYLIANVTFATPRPVQKKVDGVAYL